MIRNICRVLALLVFCAFAWTNGKAYAQGVTTGAITGTVKDAQGGPVSGASVIARHLASGSQYGALTRADGRYTVPGMRVGGPYTVTVSHIGFEAPAKENVTVNLGTATEINFVATERAIAVAGVTVTAEQNPILSPQRTGAATSVSQEALQTLPTVSRRIEDFARLSPQYSGAGFGFSFGGQDNRMNNLTVDGSYFNNSFGLGGQPGDRTGVAPISLDALEQVQVNIAPFDVRQGNFIGAGVNTVTRSGTNQVKGSIYYQLRNEDFVGKKAGDLDFNPGTFKFHNLGGWISGPIFRNKLFFFASYEDENTDQPGTTWRANRGEPVAGNITRVPASTLDSLSAFLKTSFNYETGPYEGYPFTTPATRALAKLDYNLNQNNKFSLRFTDLESSTDVLESTSSSLGFGSRRSNPNSLNFANSNYSILENIRSVVGEWNSTVGTNKSNNLIVGYTYQDESRGFKGSFFPLVDIVEGGKAFTSFGFEPFSPANQLRYKTAQLQDNFTIYGEKHSVTFGVTAEKYHSMNVFFFGSQSAYTYNSLADFYTDAKDYAANPNRTTSPVKLRRFQVAWSNIPGQDEPVQPLDVLYAGAYVQDQWQVTNKLNLTAGIRLDVPRFGNTAFDNPLADQLNFRDENGQTVQYNTGKLPDPRIHWSPRFGFNYDVTGDRSTQIRGGTGIFTGRPAYVWISNQIGNTGVLTGFLQKDDTKNFPFNPDPNHYKPQNVTGAPASSYTLNVTDPDFKFPQLWRSDIAIDQKLPWGLVGTAEFLYSKDVNGIYYINANLPAAQTAFTGADNRPRWTSNRINSNVNSNIVLKNQNVGFYWSGAASLEKSFASGFFAKAAYSYGVAKNTVDPGSIASGSWTGNPIPGDPNNPPAAFAATSPGHRGFLASSYDRNFFGFGRTTLSLFLEGHNQGNASYRYSGDLNGDGAFNNDLIYIPKDKTEMNFLSLTSGGKTFTPDQQQDAWEAFIQQDDYLSSHRGQYAERNAVFVPMVWRADVSIAQEVAKNLGGRRNGLQLRADILNFGNLVNHNWGTGQRLVTTTPLISAGADAQGRVQYRLATAGTGLISQSLAPTSGTADVYRIQFSLRYNFE